MAPLLTARVTARTGPQAARWRVPAPRRAFGLSLPLGQTLALSAGAVALTTGGLYRLQQAMLRHDHVLHVRPFSIGYLVPVVLVTAVAGRRGGWATLALSALALVYFLMQPRFAWRIENARDGAELLMLLLVGALVVSGVEAMRQNRVMFVDITDAAEARDAQEAVRRAAGGVPGVRRVSACALRRCGLDLYVDLDLDPDGDGSLPLDAVRRLVADVESAVYRAHPLVQQVRARVR